MKKSLLDYCGLTGVAAFVSYAAAVVFAPLAYPGYDWMSQAVSDLSAANAPSLMLWNRLSCIIRQLHSDLRDDGMCRYQRQEKRWPQGGDIHIHCHGMGVSSGVPSVPAE